jgi:hypothetical protein
LINESRTATKIIYTFIFIITLIFSQLMSYILKIDFLAIFPGINFIMLPLCIGFASIIFYILYRSPYFVKNVNLVNNLVKWIKQYPRLYMVMKLIDKHPIVFGLIIGAILTILPLGY